MLVATGNLPGAGAGVTRIFRCGSPAVHTDQPHPEPYSRGTEEMGELGLSESRE